MADDKRPWHETRDIGVQRYKDEWNKNRKEECPSSEVKKFEKLMKETILPKIYDKK